MSAPVFNIFKDAHIDEWQSQLQINFKLVNQILNASLSADGQVIFA